MTELVDTCGWIEWLTQGRLASRFAPHLRNVERLVVPTSVQFELYKWVCRERDEPLALEIVALSQRGQVRPLTTEIALKAADLSAQHKLAFADAIVYATAQLDGCPLITSDQVFSDLPGVIYFKKPA